MRIFSKLSLQFDDPAGEQPAVLVKHQSFAVVPDWVADSTMFKLASAEGNIEILDGRQDVKAAELGDDSEAAKLTAEALAEAEKAAAAGKK
jgi:hypothetical protein